MKKKKKLEIDSRDRNKGLWEWLLANSQQQPEEREKHSRIAKQRSDEYWVNHSLAVTEDHRRKREAWLTDQERLLTAEEDAS